MASPKKTIHGTCFVVTPQWLANQPMAFLGSSTFRQTVCFFSADMNWGQETWLVDGAISPS